MITHRFILAHANCIQTVGIKRRPREPSSSIKIITDCLVTALDTSHSTLVISQLASRYLPYLTYAAPSLGIRMFRQRFANTDFADTEVLAPINQGVPLHDCTEFLDLHKIHIIILWLGVGRHSFPYLSFLTDSLCLFT